MRPGPLRDSQKTPHITAMAASASTAHAHIACDAASNSEIVVPIVVDGEVLGVLDLDSPNVGRFDAEDKAGCEALVALLGPRLKG